jgi:3-hydroxyisobutyrate dehydrogenase
VVLGAEGVLAGAAPGTVYVDLSTNSPSVIRRLAQACAERGVMMLDAPVSGGSRGAAQGTLAVMVGGDAAVYERIEGVLRLIGDKVSYIGPIGNGTVAKLAHNMISIGSRMIVAEAFTLGVKAGVSPQALLRAVQGGSFGQGRLIHHTIPDVVFKGDFDNVGFSLGLSLKDLRLALDLAREYGVPVKFTALAEQETAEAAAEGLGEKDSSATFLLQERRAGVQVRG